jgi:hypothetical protein
MKNNFYLLKLSFYKIFIYILLIIYSNSLKSQISNIIPSGCLPDGSNQIWKNAGSSNFSDGITVDQYIDVTELGISTSSSDNSGILNTKISEANPPPGEFIVFYFPGSKYEKYTFLNPINLKSNIIIKGECASKVNSFVPLSQFYFDLGANDIKFSSCFKINGCKNVGFQDFYVHQELRITDNAWNNTSFGLSDYKNYTFKFSNTEDCFIQGVYSQYTQSHHIQIVNSKYMTIFGNYFWGANDYSNTGYGRGYGIQLNNGSQYCLIENNIFYSLRHAIVLQKNAKYNVLGYNYSLSNYAYNCKWIFGWKCHDLQLQDIAFHGSKVGDGPQTDGPKYNLCEGNFVDFISFDKVNSYNGPYNVLFRNYAGKIRFQGGNMSQSEKHDYQFKQVIVGDNDNPNYETYKDIRDYGCYQTFWYEACGIWDVCPLWDDLPYYHYSYYKEDPPDWWPSGESWPYVPNEGNPAKDRFDDYSPLILSCWDSKKYKNMCAPGIFYPGKDITHFNLQKNFKATEYITASAAITTTEKVTFNVGTDGYIELNPGFETYDGGEFETYIDPTISCDFCNKMLLGDYYPGAQDHSTKESPKQKSEKEKTENKNNTVFKCNPNPFNNSTQIIFSIQETTNVRLYITSIYGIEVLELVNNELSKGIHNITIKGSALSSGIYYCILETKDRRSHIKLVKM